MMNLEQIEATEPSLLPLKAGAPAFSALFGPPIDVTRRISGAEIERATSYTSLTTAEALLAEVAPEVAREFRAQLIDPQLAAAHRNPDCTGAWVAAARGLLMLNDAQGAVDLLLPLEHRVGEYWATHYLSVSLWRIGRKKEAYDLLRRAVADRPMDFRPQHALAGLLLLDGDQQSALTHLEKAASSENATADVLNDLGAMLLVCGDFNRALKHLRSALAKQPRHSLALNNMGICSVARGKVDLGLKYFFEAIISDRSCHDAVCNLAEAYLQQGRYAAAADVLESHKEEFPNDSRTTALLAFAYLKQTKHQRAERLLRSITQRASADAGDWNNLGLVLALQDKWEDAEEAFREALVREPQQDIVLVNLFGVLRKTGRIERFLHVIDEDVAAQSIRVSLIRTRVLLEADRPEDALAGLMRSLERRGESSDLLVAIGYILMSRVGNLQLALQYLRRAVAADGSHRGAANNLGYAYIRLGELEKAREVLEPHVADAQADQRSDWSICLLASWGLLLIREKKFDEGMAYYVRAEHRAQGVLKQRIKDKMKIEQGRYLLDQGQAAKAAFLLQQVRSKDPEFQQEATEILRRARALPN